jgi:hypothetical protein
MFNSDILNPSVKDIHLKVMKESVQMELDALDLDMSNYQFEVDNSFLPELGKRMVLRLTRRIATENLDTIELPVPASWWQHFKAEHFPRWMKRKFPVKYNYHQWSVTAYYDKISIPEYTPHIVFNKLEDIPYDDN